MKALNLLVELREMDYRFGASKEDLKVYDEAIAELEEDIKPKTCDECANYLKDRTIYYDGKKVLLCLFCKYNDISYFKQKA